MRYFTLFIALTVMMACQQPSDNNSNDADALQEQSEDYIRTSQTYKNYVLAHADYDTCVNSNAKLTKQLTNGEITREKFDEAVKRNSKVCRLKKQVVDLYWRVLQEEFDAITTDYQLTTD